jgi:micrococcal nuclease
VRLVGALVLLAVAGIAAADVALPPMPDGLERATVTTVNDGDTVVVRLRGRREHVRLMGVDCPELHDSPKLDRQLRRGRQTREEIVAMGARADAVTRRALLDHEVLLEYDVERRDRFGRLLAYVWLPDGTLYNAVLLRDGWARILTFPPNVRYVDLFRRLDRQARAEHRGLWATAAP